ncbi:MAG: hypothetical protein WBF66_01100 [Dehalococcoidia bacterium]
MTDDKELATMTAVAKALDAVKDEEELTGRVLQWVNSRYGKGKAISPTGIRGGQSQDVKEGAFTDLAALFAAARPTTKPECALVAGYWFQVHEKKENLDAQSVNTALKQLGHPISNITDAFSSLKAKNPALAMQVHKSGTSRQARKKYRLTNAGLEAVREMLSAHTEE